MSATEAKALADAFYRIGAIRFGDFVLKDGRHSPIYVDMRVLIGAPDILRQAAAALVRRAAGLRYDCIAGIPYAGLPLGVAMALESGTPLVYPRKEAKAYGTGRMVEGVFKAGDRALVVDDVITTGGAKLEAIQPLHDAGLVVEDVLVVVDRQQSGAETLKQAGLRLHSVITIGDLLSILHAAHAISDDQLQRAIDFVKQG